MKASKEDQLQVYVGAAKPNIFRYWTWWHCRSTNEVQEKHDFLQKLSQKGLGFGHTYYYNGNKIWFHREQDLLVYELKFYE